jgi:hypothetical protein
MRREAALLRVAVAVVDEARERTLRAAGDRAAVRANFENIIVVLKSVWVWYEDLCTRLKLGYQYFFILP